MIRFELSDHAAALMSEYYLSRSEETIEEAFRRASYAYTKDSSLAERIYDYVSKGWFMFSSPVLSNAGTESLPISCFLTYVDDSVSGLIGHSAELRWMSVLGGGVGGHWSEVRAVSEKSPGPIPFLKTVDSDVQAFRQGSTRKGSYSAYLDISHPEVLDFLSMRTPTGGDINRKCFNLHHAINIPSTFMDAVTKGTQWDLVDPKTQQVRESVPARELWQRILETRFRTGEPYLCFIDTANEKLPKALKEKGLKIHGSNLCSEIFLPTSKDRSAVCCLSSLNIERFDEWENTTIVEDLIRFLDDVLEYFIENAPDELAKAKYSAARERSLGLGAMGFHAYLQKHMIPFESLYATIANRKIFSTIKERAVQASAALAREKGEFPDGLGYGLRNAHLLAVAPNANSAVLLDTSPSIEPWKSNAYTHRSRAGSFLHVNPYLIKILKCKPEINYDDAIQDIILNQGSVQHVAWLSDLEKSVFKTAFELDQHWVIEHAAVRQEWICQGQSLNLFFPSGSDINYVNSVHLAAFKKGLKAVYYLRTNTGVVAEKVSAQIEKPTHGIEECLSCQG